MKQTLVIIHTSPATVELLRALVTEILPDVQAYNLLDDSMLPQLAENGGDLSAVSGRWMSYAQIAVGLGADCILSACSSVGELAERARAVISVPVLRIDDAMAEAAVRGSRRIGVLGTLQSTMEPTAQLIERKAAERSRSITLQARVVDGAYQRLMEGDRVGHDAAVLEAIEEMAGAVDTVLLAQASMARVASALPEELLAKVTSSPRLGIKHVKRVMGRT